MAQQEEGQSPSYYSPPSSAASSSASPVADGDRKNILAPFNPTCTKAQETAIEMLALTCHDVLFDLGCGDGRFLMKACQLTPGISCVGIELDPFFVERARRSLPSDVTSNLEIRQGDALDPGVHNPPDKRHSGKGGVLNEDRPIDEDDDDDDDDKNNKNNNNKNNNNDDDDEDDHDDDHDDDADKNKKWTDGSSSSSTNTNLSLIHDATAVFVYLLPRGLQQVKPLLERVARQRRREGRSFRIASYMFHVNGWDPIRVDRSTKGECGIYLYDVAAMLQSAGGSHRAGGIK